MPPDLRRLRKEYQEACVDSNDSIKLNLKDETNLTHMVASFPGPEGTPYEGGIFELDIQIPENYPFSPPKVKFITPVYHPNVSSQTGAICLDTLQKEWTPVLNLKATVLSVQQLLLSPEPDDPQDAQVAHHMKTNLQDYLATAKQWTVCYATPTTPTTSSSSSSSTLVLPKDKKDDIQDPHSWIALGHDPEHVQLLKSMGFDLPLILKVLKQTQGNVEAAIDMLVNQQP